MTALDPIVASAPTASARPLLASLLARAAKLWRSESAWSLADQGVASLGNFATTVLVLRGLSMQACGLFGVLLETTMFLNNVHAPLLTYPLSVRGAKATDESTAGKLAGASLSMTALAGVVLMVVGAVAGLASHRLAPVFLAAVAATLWQMQEVARRTLIARRRLICATLGDAISYLGQAAAICLLLSRGFLTLDRVFILMAATSAAGLLFQGVCIGVKWSGWRELRARARDFWGLGRWPLASSLTSILTIPAFSWTLYYFHGPDAVAASIAMLALLKASHPIMFAAMNLIIPSVARAQSEDETGSAAWRAFLKQASFGVVILAPYFLALALVPAWILNHAYHGRYVEFAWILRVNVAAYAVMYAANMTSAYLDGLGRTRSSFNGQLSNAVTAASIGLPLTAVFGLFGSAVGGGISVLARLATNVVSIRRAS